MATLGDGGTSRVARLLTCRVDAKLCALSLDHVVETLRPLPLEPLSDLPSFVAGLAMIRGRPTPVLDARTLLGSADCGPPSRWVSLSWQARNQRRDLAFAVDAVVGVVDLASARVTELPPLMRSASARSLEALAAIDGDLLLLLEHTRLLPEALLQALAAREVAT